MPNDWNRNGGDLITGGFPGEVEPTSDRDRKIVARGALSRICLGCRET